MIWYFPLEHSPQRYTTHLDRDIESYLLHSDKEYESIMPENYESPEIPKGCFLNAAFTSQFKAAQLTIFFEHVMSGDVKDGDTLFFSDLWFPGIESIAYVKYFHNLPNLKIKGIIHAGSFTDTDFVRDMERWAKNFEDIIFDISDEVFVASEFIKTDILKKRFVQPEKLVVTGLPLDTIGLDSFNYGTLERDNIVVFNGRNCDEKQPHLFKKLAEEMEGEALFVNTQKQDYSKEEYYQLLSYSKVVVSYALQENFGYGIAEAAYLGCIPVLPNRLVYPELYAKEYLYETFDESVALVRKALSGELKEGKINSKPCPITRWFK